MVEQGGAQIGNTPLSFHLSGTASQRLTVTLAGHRPVVVAVSADSPEQIQVTLTPGSEPTAESTRSHRNAPAAAGATGTARPPTRGDVPLDVVDPWN
jgi:hypothetical protein